MINPHDAPKAQDLSSPPELKKGAVWIAVLAGSAIDRFRQQVRLSAFAWPLRPD